MSWLQQQNINDKPYNYCTFSQRVNEMVGNNCKMGYTRQIAGNGSKMLSGCIMAGKHHNTCNLLGRLPFGEKFGLEFFGNFQLRKEQQFWNFRKRAQPCEVHWNFPNKFRSIWLPPRNSRYFLLNRSLFGNSTIFGFSGSFPRKYLRHLSPFRNFRKFSLNGKRS